jgi:hypothetical protein
LILDLQLASLPDIAAHYQSDNENWVRANMIISQDGHFVGPSDSSRDLTGESDLKLLLLLRALSDVVLVGANTARMENYRQPKAREEFAFLNRKPPRIAVVSSSLDFDLSAPLFHGGLEKTIVINVGDKTPSAELNEIAHVVECSSNGSSSFVPDLIAALNKPWASKSYLRRRSKFAYSVTGSRRSRRIRPHSVTGNCWWFAGMAWRCPRNLNWDQVGTAVSGDFEFKRLLLRR